MLKKASLFLLILAGLMIVWVSYVGYKTQITVTPKEIIVVEIDSIYHYIVVYGDENIISGMTDDRSVVDSLDAHVGVETAFDVRGEEIIGTNFEK